MTVLICNNCKKYWIAPMAKCECGCATLTVTHPSNADVAETWASKSVDNITELETALKNEIWKDHKVGDTYTMDGKSDPWKIAYYPLFGTYNNVKDKDGEILEVRWADFEEPRALVEKPAMFEGEPGTDFREVPMRYLTKK